MFRLLIFLVILISRIKSLYGEVIIDRISDERGIINESPFWDDEEQVLYWLDIRGRTVYKYDGESVVSIQLCGGMISGIIPVSNNPGYFIIGIETKLSLMFWSGVGSARFEHVATVDEDKPGNRFNDGKCDSKGRLWIGTMGPQNYTDGAVEPLQGSLYMVSSKDYKNPEKKISPVSISNGLAWSNDDTKFFFIDSPTRAVFSYDYDRVSGNIANQQVLFSLDTYNIDGIPDGMTIDENDNLWVAVYDGGVVVKVDSTSGKLLETYPLPALQVSSVVWGGANLDTLYVTTGSQYLSEEELREQQGAGHVFAMKNLGEKGSKSVKFYVGKKLNF